MRRARRWLLVASGAALAAWGAACTEDAARSPGADGGAAETGDAGAAGVVDAGNAEDSSSDAGMMLEQAAAPTFTPPGGDGHAIPPCVTIATTTPDATIHFTTDGTPPSAASEVYAKPIAVWFSQTLRAIAIAPSMEPSSESVATYGVSPKGVPKPVTASPGSGEYDAGIGVTLAFNDPPSTVCYTLDGTNPTCGHSGPLLEYCSPVAPAPAPCGATSMTFAGEPVLISRPADGGSVLLRATSCNTRGSSEVTTSTYTFE